MSVWSNSVEAFYGLSIKDMKEVSGTRRPRGVL